jgi:hypothetical protein
MQIIEHSHSRDPSLSETSPTGVCTTDHGDASPGIEHLAQLLPVQLRPVTSATTVSPGRRRIRPARIAAVEAAPAPSATTILDGGKGDARRDRPRFEVAGQPVGDRRVHVDPDAPPARGEGRAHLARGLRVDSPADVMANGFGCCECADRE